MTIGRSELQQQETSAERGTVSSDTMTEISAQILTESAQKTDGDDTVHATTTTAAMDENYTKKNVNHDTRLNGGMESSDQTNHYSNKMPHTTTRRPEGEQDESLSRDDDDSDDDDSRNDRKPAAKPMKNDNENYDVSDKEECDTDDEEDESKPTSAVVVTEDGRILSDYEIQRLERIKRNRQYLAQLGLEGKEGGGGVWGERPPKKKRSRPKPVDAPVLPSRSSMSRRTKLNPVSYVEPPTSVRDLMRSDKNDKPQTDSIIHTTKITTTADTDTILATDTTTASAAAAAAETDTASTTPDADIGSTNGEQEHQQLVQPPTAKTNQLPVRKNSKKIEQPIYYEFKRIRALKRINLKKAERNFKVAEKQAMYWNKFVTVWERRNERKLEATRRRQVETAEKGMFGGKSIQDLLSEIDNRMPAIEQAIERYDDSIAVRMHGVCAPVRPW